MTTVPTIRGSRPVSAPVAAIAGAILTALVLAVLLPNLWYQLHDVSDIPVYQGYSLRMANGERPFTPGFKIEYPPLAVPLFRLPGHADDPAAYQRWFSIDMGIITVLTAIVVALVACRFWPRGGRAYVAAVLFPVGVALTGAIIVNRYDAAVALLVAIFLLCLSQRWYIAAAFVLGMGFALKITPVAMLPLVLLLVGHPRRWLWPLVAFTAAAAAPFLPYLFSSPGGLWYVFKYHLERPLQIESVLGTPMLLGQLLGAGWAGYGHSHGSHSLIAPGVALAANLSGGLTLLAVTAVYLLVWQRRTWLRATPPDQAIAVLALIVALMAFGKVLSPQYFIWVLPAWALVAARDKVLGIVGGLTLWLTQAEFPALYWSLLDMQKGALAVVVARNSLLVALFAVAAWRLWRLPDVYSVDESSEGRSGT